MNRFARLLGVNLPAASDLVEALRAVPGVADAELVPPAGGPAGAGRRGSAGQDAGTLRIALLQGADEVAVATAVNRVLRERFGLTVDSGRVQVVEESVGATAPAPSADRPAGSPARHLSAVSSPPDEDREIDLRDAPDGELLPRGERLLIQRLQLVSGGPGVSVAVTLGRGGRAHVGEAAGSSNESSVHRTVGEATLRAVEAATGRRASFVLEDVDVVTLGTDRVVLVRVHMTAPWGVERLTGTSAVREDVRQAVIRATLDSLNRRVEAVLEPA